MYGFKILVKGEYALFSRPEMKVERVSYDVPTPSAFVGLLKNIYWHPGVVYVIDKIYVYNPINFINIRRNEVKDKLPLVKLSSIKAHKDVSIPSRDIRTQRASMLLKDVEYGVEFHFKLTSQYDKDFDNISMEEKEKKCFNIIKRRLENGQFFNAPCLGCREFGASVSPVDVLEKPAVFSGDVDLGFMLYDLVYKDDENGKSSDHADPRFYRPHMIDGVIDVKAYAGELLC